MISTKELLDLESYLRFQRTHIQTLEYLHHTVRDTESKQYLLDLVKKNQNQFSTISKHINAGQPMYP
ncbi:hypothetical protein HSX37_09365|uniref:Coat F domain-containing protein n=1 Tax=Dendrosporobacter quercicolus TaxID=146817 RepID=A0A1G9QGJ0_9FIRM|nr:hypothetical protein [Dendrosporobacter quercicolus]NSL48237.1 hypothetical protein [Dendrosporobacter quercicolus DSM 1736]SDM10148.1 hypothetical protein SAMN04488502_102167 [Dendrosporobacter quercicolus]